MTGLTFFFRSTEKLTSFKIHLKDFVKRQIIEF